jgi:dihydrofolate synthase/folylpolyglutamate synthase
MNYSQSVAYLRNIQERGAKLALGNIKKVIDQLPFKLTDIKFVQVAGTNGKGSTSHFITSILQSASYRVGLFTSPHLQNIRERITINKEWISETDFANSLKAIRDISETLLEQNKIDNIPTFFEHLFLVSLFYFHQKKVNFAVFEVGLGGRLDATSTINSEISVITNISLDHTKTLGRKIRDIAFEKAGIIKKNTPVISGCNQYSISRKVVKDIARKQRAPFYDVITHRDNIRIRENKRGYSCRYATESNQYLFNVYLNGKHQAMNAATAIRAIEILNQNNGLGISKSTIYRGIRNNFIPGRIEIIDTDPGIILDGGHNVESIRALNQFLQQKNYRNLTLVFGVLRDKNYRKMIALLRPFIKRVVITQPISQRALPADRLVRFFNTFETQVKLDLGEALDSARKFKTNILVTGSLYLVGEMRNLIFGGTEHGYK